MVHALPLQPTLSDYVLALGQHVLHILYNIITLEPFILFHCVLVTVTSHVIFDL